MTFGVHLITPEAEDVILIGVGVLRHTFMQIGRTRASRVWILEVNEEEYLMLKLKYGKDVWKR